MKLKILVGVLIFLILINLATIGSFVYMQFNGKNNKHSNFNNGNGAPPPREQLMLKLNQKQKEQLGKLLNEFQMKARPYKEQIRILDDETYDLMKKDSVSQDELNDNLKKISNIRLKISQLAIKNMLDAKNILSPEQLELFYNSVIRPIPQGPPPPRAGNPPGQDNLPGRRMP